MRFILLLLLFFCAPAFAEGNACEKQDPYEPELVTPEPEHYGSDKEHLIDVWVPKGKAKPYKTVVLYHGGCFQEKLGSRDADLTKQHIMRLVRAGYAVASVDYRTVQKDLADPTKTINHFPASLDDANDAWCFLQNEGRQKYGLDTSSMTAMGFSAGATLAMYVGTGHTAGTDHRPNCQPRVAGIVDFYGRMMFKEPTEKGGKADCGENYVGLRRNNENPQKPFWDADVYSHLDPSKVPPVYMVHGDKDKYVDWIQSYTTCLKLGKSCQLQTVPGANHMFQGAGEMDKAFNGTCQFLADKAFAPNFMQMAGFVKKTAP